jgi:hypothetical protein
MPEPTLETDPLQEVRDRAEAHAAVSYDDEKTKTLTAAAVRAAAREAVEQGGASKEDVAEAAGVQVGELDTWLT